MSLLLVLAGIQMCYLTMKVSTTEVCDISHAGLIVTLKENGRSYTMKCSCALGCRMCNEIVSDYVLSECYRHCEVWNAFLLDHPSNCSIGYIKDIKKRSTYREKLTDSSRFLRG